MPIPKELNPRSGMDIAPHIGTTQLRAVLLAGIPATSLHRERAGTYPQQTAYSFAVITALMVSKG
jgi:hypothetical protein